MDNNVVSLPNTPSTENQSVTSRNEPTPIVLAIHYQGMWEHYRGEVALIDGKLELSFLPGNLTDKEPFIFYGEVADMKEAAVRMTEIVWAQFDA